MESLVNCKNSKDESKKMNQDDFEKLNNFIKELLYEKMTIEDYEIVINTLGGNLKPRMRSICHNINPLDGGFNLSFDENTRSFFCYSRCCCSMSLLSLVKQRRKILNKDDRTVPSLKWICETIGVECNFQDTEIKKNKSCFNWKASLSKYINKDKSITEDKILDNSILEGFPKVYHTSWIDNNISIETMEQFGIRYYPYKDCIVIPCRNIDGELIGIRGRYMNPNSEHRYYPIQVLDGTQYKFLTNNSLYGLWFTKEAIKRHKKVVIGEAEKFTLQCQTFFGADNFSCSLYGSVMSKEKLKLLLGLGIEEAIISVDFDYVSVDDKDFEEEFKKKVYKIGEYFKPYCKVTAMVSYGGHNIKDSATDHDKEWYLKLYNEREELY